MAFQMKCFKKFQDFQEEGRTILFVTHALDTVIRYCTRGIVIDAGEKVCDDSSKEAVDIFKKVLTGNFYKDKKSDKSDTAVALDDETLILKEQFPRNQEILEYGNNKVTTYDYGMIDFHGDVSTLFDYNSASKIVMKVEFNEAIKDPIFAFTIKDAKGLEITGTNSMMKHLQTGNYKQGDRVTITFQQNMNLQLGKYALSLGCVGINDSGIEVYSRLYDAVLFEVIGSEKMVGLFDLHSEISIE